MHYPAPSHLGLFAADCLHRCDDIRVGSAAADVPAERLLYIVIGGTPRFLQHGGGGHYLAAGAITTLITLVFQECGLDRMHAFGRTEAFNGGDFCILLHQCKNKAAIRTAAINVYRARAALPVVATLLGAG